MHRFSQPEYQFLTRDLLFHCIILLFLQKDMVTQMVSCEFQTAKGLNQDREIDPENERSINLEDFFRGQIVVLIRQLLRILTDDLQQTYVHWLNELDGREIVHSL